MSLSIENILLVGALLLLVSIVLSRPSYRFGVPILLFFLLVGILAGADGILGIAFDNPGIAQFIGVVCLNFILFSGGLETHWKAVRPVLKEGLALSSLGVFLTAAFLGTFVYFLSDFTLAESMLLGSIVSSTDAAAVFSLLRSKSIALREHLRPTLELESGSNDPMAYVLTISCLALVTQPDLSFWSIIPMFLSQMFIGLLAGFFFAWLCEYIVNHIRLSYEGLYPTLIITLMFLVFSLTDLLGGNGFLAIYICGVYLGNRTIVHKRLILQMYDGMAWLMQIVLFVTLGLLVTPSSMGNELGIGLMVSAFLILVARPLAVLLTLLPFKMRLQRRLYISWVGLKGAVPIVFATYPLIAGVERAPAIFNIVFFISVSSLLIQGTTLGKFSVWLNVDRRGKEKIETEFDRFISNTPKQYMQAFHVKDMSQYIGKKAVAVGFPSDAIMVLIKRQGKYLNPDANTVLERGDVMVVLSDSLQGFEGFRDKMDVEDLSF